MVHIPERLEDALDPAWLTEALAEHSGGARVTSVKLAELIKTMASKARVEVEYEGRLGVVDRFCLKAFLDEPGMKEAGETTIREGRFYLEIAPRTTMRLPSCAAVLIDRENGGGLLVMDDLVAKGAHFCNALEHLGVDFVRDSLDQLARLHAAADLLDTLDWVPDRMQRVADKPHFSAERLDEMLSDPRGETLSERTRSGAPLLASLKVMAARSRQGRPTLLHGDVHAGNLFKLPEGPGFTDWQLIQRGHWALDVAYHIPALLSVEDAATHERALLDHYLEARREHGAEAIDREEAWATYRAFLPYGFYQWAITQRVHPPITYETNKRLGGAVDRHDSYRLLGV